MAIHPTQFNKDNINGYLGLVETDAPATGADENGRATVGESSWSQLMGGVPSVIGDRKGRQVLLFWVPEEVVERMDQEDKEGYKKVEERWAGGIPREQDPKEKEDDGVCPARTCG